MYLRYIVACALFALAASTDVSQCPGRSISGLKDDIQLQSCKKPPCRLKKGTDQPITIYFTPEKDLPDVTNHVTADVFGLPVPFIGVDGNSVCDKLENDKGEKVSCPLKADTRYVYKDSFPILKIYPSLTTKVHWALQHNEKDISCFEVSARII